MAVKWRFDDLTDSSFAVFEVNPDASADASASASGAGSSGTASYPPTLQKTITSLSTVAPGGRTLIFEGANAAPAISFSGTILTQTMYNMMVTWFNKSHQIQLTDDLGKVYMVYITEFAPVRVRMASNPWYHTYSVTTQILNWP